MKKTCKISKQKEQERISKQKIIQGGRAVARNKEKT